MMASPPLIGDWWRVEHDHIVTRALAVMRMDSPTEPDLQRVNMAADAAGRLIDDRLDRCTPLPVVTPEPILTAAVEVTVEMYRRKDAPFGTVGGWADGAVAAPIYPDPLSGVWPMIAPYRQRMGVA
jgi:hypothetical protein